MAKEKDIYVKTSISVLFKNSSRANAKLRMKVFHTKNIDQVLDPEIKLRGVPDTAEIIKIGVGKASIQDFKDIIDPPKVEKVIIPKKAIKPAPKKSYYQRKKEERDAANKAR